MFFFFTLIFSPILNISPFSSHFHIYSLITFFFFFNDTAPTEISPLSLPDALPIYFRKRRRQQQTATRQRPDHLPAIPLISKRSDHPRPLIHKQKRIAAQHRMHVTTPRLRLATRSEEHTSELQSQSNLVCRLLLEKK